jgi:hypothetical protein
LELKVKLVLGLVLELSWLSRLAVAAVVARRVREVSKWWDVHSEFHQGPAWDKIQIPKWGGCLLDRATRQAAKSMTAGSFASGEKS